MSLKYTADKVLQRDSFGKNAGKDTHIISQPYEMPLTQAVIDLYQERAAIMEFDGGMSRQEAEGGAFRDCACLCRGYKQ